jgi:hypothetical protein
MSPTDESGGHWSRRHFLRAGGAALAFGTAAGTAGCQSGLPPLSGPINFGRLDAPEPGDAEYRRWIPAPAALDDPEADDESDGVADVWYAQPRRLSESAFGSGALPIGLTTARLDYFGTGYQNYDEAVALLSAPVIVALADIDRATVASALDGTGYETRTSYRGFDVYSRFDVPRTVAVSDTALVYAESGQDRPAAARDHVETVIDTAAGRSPRRWEQDAAFGTLLDRVGARPGSWLGLAQPFGEFGSEVPAAGDELLLSSTSWEVDSTAVYFIQDLVYAEERDAPGTAIKRALENQQRALDSSLVDVETDGRFARIEMRRSRDSVEADQGPPQITWGVTHDRESETVTLTNEAGASADPATLSLDGDPGNTAWDTIFAEFDVFAPGDSVTVDVGDLEPSDTVRVVYSTPDGNASMTVFGYSLPDELGRGSDCTTVANGGECE